MIASASAPSIEVSTCEPCVLGRRRVPAVVAQLEPAADQRGRGRAASGSRASRIAVARAALVGWRRASRGSPGRTKSRKVTIAETGLPGRPKTRHARTRRRAGIAEPGRLAGAQRDAPEDLLDAELGERRADVVVLADRDAAADHDDVGRRAPARAPPRSPRGRRARSRPRRARRPSCATSAATRVGVGVADRARAQRLARLLELVAGGQHADPGPARAGDLAAPDRGEHPELGRPELGARPRAPPRPARDVLAGAADVAAGLDLDPNLDRLRAAVGVLDPDDRIGALGHHRPGRDRDRLARRRAPRCAGCAGARLGDHRQRAGARRSRRRCRRRGPRTRPSPSCRTRARRRRCATSSASTRPSASSTGDRLARRAARPARAPAAAPPRSRSACRPSRLRR